jgi:hypothetical protein
MAFTAISLRSGRTNGTWIWPKRASIPPNSILRSHPQAQADAHLPTLGRLELSRKAVISLAPESRPLCEVDDRTRQSQGVFLSNSEDAELLVYLVDEEMDIYIGVLVVVYHLGPVGRVLSAISMQLNLYEYMPPSRHRLIIS